MRPCFFGELFKKPSSSGESVEEKPDKQADDQKTNDDRENQLQHKSPQGEEFNGRDSTRLLLENKLF